MSKPRRKALICSQSNFDTDYRIHKLAALLRIHGYDVEMLSRSHPHENRVSSPGVRYAKLFFWHGPLFYAEFNLRLFASVLFGRKRDLIVSIDLDTLGGILPAAKLRRTPVLFDSHEYFPGVPEIQDKPFVRWVWERVQDLCVPRVGPLCVTVCQSIADIFAKRYGTRFMVVRNVPMSDRAPSKTPSGNASSRPFTLLYQGAVNEGRGLEETVDALPLLPDCRLVVVGKGDKLEEIKARAAERGVADRVSFEGRKRFDELERYMAEADLGLIFLRDTCLNYHFALPNRTFDFIQARLPIIASRLPEIARVVEGYDVGLCVDSLQPEVIAEAVRGIMADAELTSRWRKNMDRVAPELIWENETEELRTALDSIQQR